MGPHFYLPVANTSMSLILLLGLGGVVGFLSGLFGVGGGFLLTPLLIMIGIPPTVAAASDSNQIVAASTSGLWAHAKSGNVDFKMGIYLLAGGVAGGTLGVQLVRYLRGLGEADLAITVAYVIMLGSVGTYMFCESLSGLRRQRRTVRLETAPRPHKRSLYAFVMETLPLKVEFPRSRIRVSVLVPIGLGVLVGVLAAIMGVGGGFIMVPVMVYLIRMPMHVVVGTSLFQVLFTCINVTILQASMNHTVDFLLALMLLLGSVLGAQGGARAARRLKGDQLKILLSIIVLAVMVEMLFGLLTTPEVILSYKGGH